MNDDKTRLSQHRPGEPDLPPDCFGVGINPDTSQRVSTRTCGLCPHVGNCSTLRIARFLERNTDEFFGAHLNARFPYGRADDRWRR